LKLLEERLEHAAFSPVKVRLASFLLANMDSTTGVVTGYTHAEIGDTIGALRQTVTETLSEMQNQGLVEVGHKRVRVTDRRGLEEVASGEEAVLR
jgi:CRP-like cAMP-binding protein